jgi:hypothetical protein
MRDSNNERSALPLTAGGACSASSNPSHAGQVALAKSSP